MISLAPIALFAYKRPKHTLKVLEALACNSEAAKSKLYVFCEAPKEQEDWPLVHQTREIFRQEQWCKEVEIIERKTNLGCANSIIQGVTEICDRYGRVIVLEDDLIVSPYFLQYMNTALDRYADEPKVMQISGHMFPVNIRVKTDAIFLSFTTSWGWATWQRAEA
jgi:GT2 family glycosyltransferase